MPYPPDFNPREELKKKGDRYADFIKFGLPQQSLKEFPLPSDTATDDLAGIWADKPFWDLWAQGKLHQFYLMNWTLSASGSNELKGVVRFVLRVTHLAEVESDAAEGIVQGLERETGADVAAAKTALSDIFAATRHYPFDAAKFKASLQPVLSAFPAASITCADFFKSGSDSSEPRMRWGYNLCRALHIVEQPKEHQHFANAAKPLLIGIGGYGLVELSFEETWGTSFALKRQNMNMVLDKNHVTRALVELQIASELVSPFLLDCTYSYIDGKDLVLALRMLPGGDLALYLKKEKEAAKKAKLPKTGLKAAEVQFYLASTLLGLEVLHSHGFVYRDLKDKNVLLDGNGTARLCDFGLAHNLKTGPATGKVGTKGFWAPEQLVPKETSAYDEACDLWTLAVCAYHWSTATIPFFSADGEDATNELTKSATYDKTLPHLTKKAPNAKLPKEEADFLKEEIKQYRPGLLELCEAVLKIEPKERLGYKSAGYAAIKQHAFFNGLNWNALGAGTLPPPITPKAREIHADLPRELKDEFGAWAKKELPTEAADTFKDWTRINRPVVEATAVAWLDSNPVFFDSQDIRGDALSKPDEIFGSALCKKNLWKDTISAPPHKKLRRYKRLMWLGIFSPIAGNDKVSQSVDAMHIGSSRMASIGDCGCLINGRTA